MRWHRIISVSFLLSGVIEVIWDGAGHTPSIFFKGCVFHKFYLIHSWILCPIFSSDYLNWSTPTLQNMKLWKLKLLLKKVISRFDFLPQDFMKSSSLEVVYRLSWFSLFCFVSWKILENFLKWFRCGVTLTYVTHLKRDLSQVSWGFFEIPIGRFLRTPLGDGFCS